MEDNMIYIKYLRLLSLGNIAILCAVLIAACSISEQSGQPLSADTQEVFAQTPEQHPMPTPMLVAKRTNITRAKYPVIDIHFHGGVWADAQQQLALMDEQDIAMICSMDGGYDARLDTAMQNATAANGRLINFARLNYEGINEAGWGEREAARLARSFEAGAAGLKMWRDLGMVFRNSDGSLIPTDDPRLKPVWDTCAELGRPVMIHSSDPPARWLPIGPDNERYEAGMWRSNTDGNYTHDDVPHYTELLKQQERLVAANPNTTIIAAHVASRGWDLAEVARLLDTYPNFYVDINARLQELGRQPYTCRKFMLKYAERILFGTDGSPKRGSDFWVPHWRFLETDDEYFDHPAQMLGPLGAGLQGRWKIHGVFLPDDVLKKIYYENALKLLPAKVRDAYNRLSM
jgi:predicted TIM-barrel fold metal-dependent hydrolase